MKTRILTAASGLALSAFLMNAPVFAQDRVDASGMPTTRSTPAEQAQTSDLNAQVQTNNRAADAQADANNAQYQAQQQQYQGQLQQNQAAQQQFQDQTAAYDAMRARYAAERAAYHRGIWPDRYVHWTLEQRDASLVGQRVEIVSGDRVGTVTDVARTPAGRVEALQVALDHGKVVWIDTADIRYDRADGIVMTNLDRSDLHQMADERL